MCCGVFFLIWLVAGGLFCIVVFILHRLLHIMGWVLLAHWMTRSCPEQQELWRWLLAYQVATLVDLLLTAVWAAHSEQIEEAMDSCVRPGFTKACGVVHSMLFTGLKVFWCIHIQALVTAAAPKKTACNDTLPQFMSLFTLVILLHILVVEPLLKLGASLSFWLAVGRLQAARGARPGTLESMQVVEYDASLFADADDPTDGRPQGECCFCLEDYSEDAVIVRTPCQHYMHRECLSRWLQTSYHCPICRGDLEENLV